MNNSYIKFPLYSINALIHDHYGIINHQILDAGSLINVYMRQEKINILKKQVLYRDVMIKAMANLIVYSTNNSISTSTITNIGNLMGAIHYGNTLIVKNFKKMKKALTAIAECPDY